MHVMNLLLVSGVVMGSFREIAWLYWYVVNAGELE